VTLRVDGENCIKEEGEISDDSLFDTPKTKESDIGDEASQSNCEFLKVGNSEATKAA
jgi:hypothetical protein